MSDETEIPRFFPVRQRFPRPAVEDPRAAVREELARILPEGSLRQGAEIGVTAGSRGITGIAGITKAAVDFLRERGAKPFVLPAMGSHGGARAEGQTSLIAHYGVTDKAMGCPVRADMATRSLGRTADGVEVFLAETVWNADGVLLLNRVKPHTDFKGPLESGLAKICAIGLGKYEGAREYHRNLFHLGLGEAIRQAAERVLETGKIIGGLGIIENAYHETARIAGVAAGDLFDGERPLLEEARRLMGRLPLDEVDVLLCDRLGKNISGSGLDTNIIGRSVYGYVQGVPWREGMPVVWRIVVRDVSEESDGNAVGMGHCEFVTRRFADRIDHEVTSLNAMTACAPMGARTPIVRPTDRDALLAGIGTAPRRREGPLVVWIRDTLALEHVLLSEPCRPLVEGREEIEVLEEPAALAFASDGSLRSPFE